MFSSFDPRDKDVFAAQYRNLGINACTMTVTGATARLQFLRDRGKSLAYLV